MLKQPITISIAPSRLALALNVSLAAATGVILIYYGPPWLTAVAILMAGGLSMREWRKWRRAGFWQLRWVPGIEGGWQQPVDGEWRSVMLRCDYLGPWLVGLHVAGRRHWLWPDSASRDERRALRRALLWSSSTQ